MEPEIHGDLVTIRASKATNSHYRPILANHVEEEQRVPLGESVCSCQTPSTTRTRRSQMSALVESTTNGDNPGVLHDSASEPAQLDLPTASNSKQGVLNCTKPRGHRTRPRQIKYSLGDFIDSQSNLECQGRCKYVGETRKTSCDASKMASRGTIDNSFEWVKAIRPDVASVGTEESWPSLLTSKTKDAKKRRTLEPLSDYQCQAGASNRMQDHRTVKEGYTPATFRKAENRMNITPVLLMLNKDFIVTSPLKQNLLLTLALMAKRPPVELPEKVHSLDILEGETKRQILVGQFKAFSSFLNFMLGRDAMRVRSESNAGGTSTISESLSVEYFVRRFHATDVVTEMEVEYRSFNWKKVDYICTLYGQRVGVSVTRAMSFPDPKDFSAQMAYRLLYKKLFGLVVARHGVSDRHSFSQCILHVWCETQGTARIMQREYDGVSQELDIADDVVMVLTVADGWHARPIFYESILRSPPK